MQKLLVIRGPSGSGKSSVSNEIIKRATRPTLLIGEDKIRKMFNDHKRTGHETARRLAISSVLLGLDNGYDVIYQGILTTKNKNFNAQFGDILSTHPHENYFFYLDVGFGETVKRHQSRHKKSQFGPEAMKRWWDYSLPTKHSSEIIIPEDSSLENTIKIISKAAKLELNNPTE